MKIMPLNSYSGQYMYKKNRSNTTFQRLGRPEEAFEQRIKSRVHEYSRSYVESLETKIIKGVQDLTFPRILTMDRISDSFQDDIYDSPGVITDFVLKELNDYIDILPERAEILGDNSILKIFNDLFKYRPSELADIYTGYNEYPFGILQLAGRYGSKRMTEALFDYVQIIGNNEKLCNQTYAYLDKLKGTKYGEHITERLQLFMSEKGFEYAPIPQNQQVDTSNVPPTPVLDKKFCILMEEYNLYNPKELRNAIIELTAYGNFSGQDNLLNKPYNENGDTLLFAIADIVQNNENEEILREIVEIIQNLEADFNQKDSMGFTFVEKVLYTENSILLDYITEKGNYILPKNFPTLLDEIKNKDFKEKARKLLSAMPKYSFYQMRSD